MSGTELSPGTTSRSALLPALELACPRCAARRRANATHCAECGLRLPDVRGPVPSLRRWWVRRFGWYPGDWFWLPLLALVLAVAATVAAVVVARQQGHRHAAALVATSPAAAASPVPATPADGHLTWPAGRTGWTIVIGSYPQPTGAAAARGTAARAARRRLPQVGLLDSSRFASLHPGYIVVFSGIFGSNAGARAALGRVRHAGFGGAYPGLIAP